MAKAAAAAAGVPMPPPKPTRSGIAYANCSCKRSRRASIVGRSVNAGRLSVCHAAADVQIHDRLLMRGLIGTVNEVEAIRQIPKVGRKAIDRVFNGRHPQTGSAK